MKKFGLLFRPPGERGSITPIIALGLMAFVGFLAMGIDLGQLYVVKNELQNVADGSALAAAKQLVAPQDPTNANYTAVVNCTGATTAAINCAAQNRSFGDASPIVVTASDVVIGNYDSSTRTFTGSGCSTNPINTNAVQVTVRRTGGDNPQVTTYFGNSLGVGSQKSVSATAIAWLPPSGTSALDLPFAVPTGWVAGQSPYVSNGLQRILDKFAPTPAYATDPQTYTWKDKGGSNLDTTRATFIMPLESERTNLSKLQQYIKGPPPLPGSGLQYPQVKVGQKVYPISEYLWGSNIKNNFNYLNTRFNSAYTKKYNGKWPVTVAAYSVTPVTSALPQDSWLKLASRLIPGVSQAQACMSYTVPAVYVQGLVHVDVVSVTYNSSCTTGDQSLPTSCLNTCYATVEVPQNQNSVTTDSGGGPGNYQPRDYQDINPSANPVGVFSSTPVIVK